LNRCWCCGFNLQLRPIHRPTIQREEVLVLHAGRSLSPAAKQASDARTAWSRTASTRAAVPPGAERGLQCAAAGRRRRTAGVNQGMGFEGWQASPTNSSAKPSY